MVLEVKGGYISVMDNNIFYYGKNYETPMKQNPFKQVEGYKFTLKDNILNNLKNCFFCEAVAFPHVDYSFDSKLIDPNLYGLNIKLILLTILSKNFFECNYLFKKQT